MTVQIIGASSNQFANNGDKFRATWQYFLSSLLPGQFNDVVGDSRAIREWLPSVGFVPFSLDVARPGQEVVLYDIRLLTEWGTGNKTVADVANALGPPFPVNLRMRLVKLEKVAYTSSADMFASQAGALPAAEQAANDNPAFKAIRDAWDKLWATLGTIGKVGAVVLVVAVGVYVYQKTRK